MVNQSIIEAIKESKDGLTNILNDKKLMDNLDKASKLIFNAINNKSIVFLAEMEVRCVTRCISLKNFR